MCIVSVLLGALMTRKVKSRTLRQPFVRILSVFVSFSMVLSLIPTQGAAEISDQLATGSPSTEELVAEPTSEAKTGPSTDSVPKENAKSEENRKEDEMEESKDESGEADPASIAPQANSRSFTLLPQSTTTTYTDLKPLLTSLKVDGTTITENSGNVTVYPGQLYSIELQFEEVQENPETGVNGKQFVVDKNTPLTYTFPDGFIPVATSGTLTLSSGTYDVPLNYSVSGNTATFTWGTDVSDEAFTSLANSPIAQFHAVFDGTFGEASEGKSTQFGESANIKVTVSDQPASISEVQKWGSYDPATNTVSYSVNVKSSGYNTAVLVLDSLSNASGSALALDPNSIEVKVDGNAVDFTKNSANGNGYSLTIPELKNDKTATITYKATVDLSKLTGPNGNTEAYASDASAKAALTGNTVTATSNKDTTGKTASNSLSKVEYSRINKEAVSSSENVVDGKRTTSWKVVMNPNPNVSMAGQTVTDTIDTGSQAVMDYSSSNINMRLEVTDAQGNVIRTETDQTNFMVDATQWSYSVPTTDTDPYTYTFTYDAPVDVSNMVSAMSVSNTASYSGPKASGTTGPVSQNVEPSDENKVSAQKQHGSIDITNKTIDWSITLNVPAQGLTKAEIVDTLPNEGLSVENVWSTHYDRYVEGSMSITGMATGEGYDLTLLDANGQETQNASEATKFKLVFHKANNEPGLAGPATITASYKTAIDPDLFDAYQTHTHTNSATVTANDKDLQVSNGAIVNSVESTLTKKRNGEDTVCMDGNTPVSYWKDTSVPGFKYRLVLKGVTEDSFDENGNLVVTDTFDGSSLVYCPHKYSDAQGTQVQESLTKLGYSGEWNEWDGELGGGLTVENPSEGTIRFVLNKDALLAAGNNEFKRGYVIDYELRVRDVDTYNELKTEALQNEGCAVVFNNTATWGNLPPSSATAKIENSVAGKTATEPTWNSTTGKWDINYALTINPNKSQIGNESFISATDRYENMSVDFSTIQVITDPADAANSVTWDASGHSLTFRIPNRTKATIQYTGSMQQPGDAINQLSVFGQNTAEIKKTKSQSDWNSGGGSFANPKITLLKYEDGDMTKRLSGVKFKIYQKSSTQPTSGEYLTDKDNQDNTFYWVYKDTVTTGADGQVMIDGGTSGQNWFSWNMRYMAQEQWATDDGGNALTIDVDDTPTKYVEVNGVKYKWNDVRYQFTVTNGAPDYSTYTYLNDDVVTIRNTPIDGPKLSVRANKVWEDESNKDGLRPDSVNVRLIKSKGTRNEDGDIVFDRQVVGEEALSASNSWSKTWTNLDYGYTYYVEEDSVPGYATTYTNNSITKVGTTEAQNTVTITNTRSSEAGTTSMQVNKAWQSKNGADAEAPTDVSMVTARLRRERKASTTVECDGQTKAIDGLKPGAQVTVAYAGSGGNDVYGQYKIYYTDASYQQHQAESGWCQLSGSSVTLTIGDVAPSSLSFWCQNASFDDFTFTVTGGSGGSYELDEGFSKTLRLTANNNWAGIFENLPLSANGYAYRYYVEEADVLKSDGTSAKADFTTQYRMGSGDWSTNATATRWSETSAGKATIANRSTASTPDPIEVPFSGTKTLATTTGESKTLSANQFGFTVTPDASNPATGASETALKKTGATNAANGAIDFGKVTFSKAGTWKYTVAENTIPETSGILADSKTYTVTVAVTEQEGKLVATVTDDGDAATTAAADKLDFANTQLAGTAELKVTKTVTGDTTVSTYNANESFEFRLAKDGTTTGDTLPNPATATATAGNTATFGNISYTTPGTYYYTITEHEPDTSKTAGMTYNATPVYAKVVVTKNAESKKLDTAVTYSTTKNGTYGSNPLAITNTYTAPDANAVSDTLTATKKVNNAAPGTRTFNFSATAASNNPSEGLDATQFNATVTNDDQGAISFGTLKFSKPGTWVYEVRETSTSTGSDGLTMDAAVYTVTFSVTKDVASNTLHVSKSISKKVGQTTTSPDVIAFNNTYAPTSVTVAFNGAKTLVRGALAANQFSFELQGTSANAASTHLTASNDANGNIAFGSVTYTAPGTYEYDVKETSTTAANPGFECSTTVHKLVVTVTDNNAGKLVASATVDGTNKGSNLTSVGGLDFANTVLEGTVTLGVSKTVRGNTDSSDYNANEQFTFHLAKADGSSHNSDELPAAAQAEITAKAGATASFGAITFKEPGTYYYSISEVEPNPKTVGMTYAAPQYVRVVVERNDVATQSTLKVTSITYGPNLAMLKNNTQATVTATGVVPMVNTYAKTTYTPQVTKVYRSDDGTSAPPAETFYFALADKTDAATKPGESIPDGGTSASAAFTGADTKTASFGTITYTKPGTYVYEISEQTPASSTHGTSYSTGKVNVSVAVVADANGKLTATPAITGGDNNDHQLENVHNHNADGTTVTLAGTKTLNNGVPGNRYFNFSVTRKSGNSDDVNESGLKTTAQNTDAGAIDFGSIVFTKPGTWVYEVKETSTSTGGDGLTVDPTVYTVTYVVDYDASDNDALKATRTITKPKATGEGTDTVSAITFNNVYDVEPANVTLGGTKTMRGGTVSNEQFSFELLDSSNKVTQTVKNQSDGTYTFSALSFSEEGTYTYTVREKSDAAANIVRDDTTYGVSIEVTDNHNGQMMAKVTTTNQKTHVSTVVNANAQATVTAGGLNFANVQLRGSAQLQVKKAFATDANHNSTYAGDDTFTFQVERVSGPQTGDVLPPNHEATAKVDGTATFGNILFSQEGTYFYKITEKSGANAGIAYNTEPRYAKVVVTRNTSSDPVAPTLLAEVKYGTEAVADKCNASSLTITNTAAAPALEKFVDKDVHADLAAFDSTFTYDIVAFVTADANKVEITDELIHGIAFAEEEPQVSVVDLGTAYNHKVGKASGTVAQAGTALAAGVATSTVEGSRLTVTIDDATALRGHWLKVTYAAKLNNNTVGTYAQYNNYYQHITSNGTVLEGVDHHDGVDNTASYRVYVRKNGEMPHDATYERSSNTVTVTPPVTSVSVSKAWKDAKGNDLAWPAGAVVSVALRQTANGQTTDTGQALQLSADSVSGTFNNLPVYAGRTYSVAEAGVTGVPEGYTATVTGNAHDGFAITNTAAPKPELKGSAVLSATKKMQSSVPWTSDEQFEFTLAAEDGTKIESVKVKAGETATFNELAYNKAGTYYYTISEKPGSTADLTYETNKRWAKVEVTENKEQGQLDTKVTYGTSKDACTDAALVITNVYAVPALEKYINKDVHQDLSAFDMPFTYDILAFVTADADRVVITDPLAKGVRFLMGRNTRVAVQNIGPENDHTAYGTVQTAKGTDVEEFTATVDEEAKVLTVNIPRAKAQGLRGNWVRVTYDVVLDNAVVGDTSAYQNNDVDVKTNKTVISNMYGTGHDGVATSASYEIYVQSEQGAEQKKYALEANDITVTPPTQEIRVNKVWKDAQGKEQAWPADAKVSVALLNNNKETGKTVELSANTTTGAFEGLPVYKNDNYTVAEASVSGVPQGYTVAVTGSAVDGFTITNTLKSAKTPAEPQKKDDVKKDDSSKNGQQSTQSASGSGTSSSSSTSRASTPKTGDVTPQLAGVAFAATGVASFAVGVRRRSRRSK